MDKFNSGIDTARKEYKFCLSKANELLKKEIEDRKVQRIANLERQILKIEKSDMAKKDKFGLILAYEKQLSELEGHRVEKKETTAKITMEGDPFKQIRSNNNLED